MLFRKFAGLGEGLQKNDQTLSSINALSCIAHLRKLCAAEGRYCRLGFGDCLSIKIGTERAQSEEVSKEDDVDLTAFFLMCNLHPEQVQWEERAQAVRHSLLREGWKSRLEANAEALELFLRGKELNGEKVRVDHPDIERRVILANLLLEVFEKQSGAVIVDRQNLPEAQRGIKLVLESFQGTEFSLSRCFRYAPCYLEFKRAPSFDQAKEQISRQVVVNVFDRMADLDYMMDEDLRKAIEPLFRSFVESGIKEEREGFSSKVKENLSLFLHGTPGIGKSTFVQTLAVALQGAIRVVLDEDIQIQGISDWSVERMMEQSLTKGNLVLLHLEESPENPELQDSFFLCLNKMLDRKLWFRYPDFKSNVIFVITSNHEPSDNVRAFCRKYCSLKAPTEEMQHRWVQRKLKRHLAQKMFPQVAKASVLDNIKLEIHPEAFPKATNDVRPLNSYWISIGHALWQLYSNCSSKSKESTFAVTSKGPSTIEVAFDNQKEILQTSDGYFYYSPSLVSKWKALDARSVTILNMALAGDLTPAVIVLHGGSEQWHNQTSTVLSQALRDLLEPSTLFEETSVTLLESDDEIKVLGESGDIRGGLLKFIDDATNPNSAHKQKRVRTINDHNARSQCDICLVHATVNELGSVLLRELLECGDKSRTHRLGVSKKGLVFIVRLLEGAAMTPQLESRAHQILTENAASH